MSSSKAKANKRRRQQRTETPVRRRWLLFASLAVAVAAALVLRAYWLFTTPNVDSLLDDARTALHTALEESEPARRLALARTAEQASRTYLVEGGADEHNAALLWCAALFVERATTGQALTDEEVAKIDGLFEHIVLAQTSTKDLLTATLACAQTGEQHVGGQLANELSRRGEPRVDILKTTAMFRMKVGQVDNAVDLCRELVHVEPDDPFAWEMLATVYERRGHRLQLIDIYGRLIEILPKGSEEYRRRLVLRHIEIGDVARARAEYDTLRSTAAHLAQQHPLMETELLLLEGHTTQSLERLDKILSSNPDDFDALVMMGRVLTAENRSDDAIKLLNRAVNIDEADAEAHYLLSQAYTVSGDSERGKHHATICQRLRSGVKNGDAK